MGSSQFFMLSLLSLHSLFCLADQHVDSFRRITDRAVNVDDFGAKGDGVADDSEAFKKAWHKTCTSSVPAVLLVPQNRSYMLKQLNFTGPCKSHVTFLIKGTLEASSNRSDWNEKNRRLWIVFESIRNLLVTGGGVINGNGQFWWPYSCKRNKTLPCIGAPTALYFVFCKRLRVENLRMKDSQQFHLFIDRCKRVEVSNIFVTAPEKSPNTDGIHLAGAKNVIIRNCEIRTGDDCVSILSGCKNIKVMNIFCGPGHGISIGSLGKNNSKDHVENVIVDTAILKGTENGVRIKSWQGGRGSAKRIIFQNIVMDNAENPIIINQNYCDSTGPCPEQPHAVAIKNVLYKNIKGTSASNVSVTFNCSSSVPCRGITLQDINLVGENGESTQSYFNNVDWTQIGVVLPSPVYE